MKSNLKHQRAQSTSNEMQDEARVKVQHPYLALMGLFLGGFMGMYSETALNIALPQLSSSFEVGMALMQWLVVGYMLIIGIVLPFASFLMKWFSTRHLTLFALGVFFAGSLVSGLALNFPVVLLGRIMQGIGTGLVLPLMFAMVLEVVPPSRIGAAMGATALIIMFAPAIGPTLAGMLIALASWRAVFFSFAVILLVGAGFVLRFGVDAYQLSRPQIDPLTVVASVIGFGGIVLGAGMSSVLGWLSWPVGASLFVGLLFLTIYARRQFALRTPVIDLRVFSVRTFTTGALLMMLNFGITLSAMYILPQFFQEAMLFPVSATGLLLLPGGCANALVNLVAGKLYDRIGARVPAIIGFVCSSLSLVLFLFVDADSPVAYPVMCHVLLMIGVPLAMSPCQTYALASLPANLSTDGSTVLNTLQQVLGAVCTAVSTSLLFLGQSTTAGGSPATAFANGAHFGFAFALAMAAIGLLGAFSLSRKNRRTEKAFEKAESYAMAGDLSA